MKAMKKVLALLLALAMVLALAACEFGGGKGDDKKKDTYETPLKLVIETENADNFDDAIESRIAQLNGLCQDEYEGVFEILMKTSLYDEDEMQDSFEDQLEEKEDTYGKNWECSYEINDEEEIDEDDLEDYQDEIRDAAEETLEMLENMTDDDILEIADYLGLTESGAEKFVKYMTDICKTMADIEITEGYELDVTMTIEGSEDEEDKDQTYIVYKANGCWVSEDVISMLSNIASLL